MISKEKRESCRRQEERKQLIRQQAVKRKRKIKLYIYMGIIGSFIVGVFLLGKNVGMKKAEEKFQASLVENNMLYYESDVVDSFIKEEIILVNKNNPLPKNYEVELLTLPDGVNRAAKEAYEPLCNMLKAGQKEGLNFEICSSYRDVDRQRELFEEDIEVLIQQGYSYTKAYEKAAEETMPPGCSEHSTGLAFDIVALSYQMLDEGQENTAENKWLQEHCAEYGFILRYPQNKEDITSINYESWHFRYVGEEAAEYIMEKGITLEEYLEKV